MARSGAGRGAAADGGSAGRRGRGGTVARSGFGRAAAPGADNVVAARATRDEE